MTDKKHIYRLMNEMEVDTEEMETIEVSQEEKDQLFQSLKGQTQLQKQNESKKHWPEYVLVAIIFILVLGSQTAFGQRVQATAASFIEDIRYSLSEALGNEESANDTVLSFNQTATIGEAEVRVEEMVAFEHRIVFNVLVDLAEPIEEQYFINFDQLTISVNQEPISTNSWTSQGYVVNESENVHSLIYTVSVDEALPLEDEMAIEIHLEDIQYDRLSEENETGRPYPPIEGQAHFSTETTLEALNQYTTQVDIAVPISGEAYEYVAEKMYVHPVLQYIELSTEDPDVLNHEFQLMEIRGQDEAGHQVVFELNYLRETETNRDYSFSLNEERSEIHSAQVAEAENLELQLYLEDWPENGTGHVELKPYGEPFTIEIP